MISACCCGTCAGTRARFSLSTGQREWSSTGGDGDESADPPVAAASDAPSSLLLLQQRSSRAHHHRRLQSLQSPQRQRTPAATPPRAWPRQRAHHVALRPHSRPLQLQPMTAIAPWPTASSPSSATGTLCSGSDCCRASLSEQRVRVDSERCSRPDIDDPSDQEAAWTLTHVIHHPSSPPTTSSTPHFSTSSPFTAPSSEDEEMPRHCESAGAADCRNSCCCSSW